MMNGEQVVKLIISRIDSLEESNREDHKQMLDELKELGKRVNSLEQFRAKVYAYAGVVAFVITVVTDKLLSKLM